MRHVLKDANEVAHFWANQTQADGRASSIFFDGPSIFSYGRHFEIARIVRAPYKASVTKGSDARGIILLTSRSYSVTTRKHKSDVMRAIDGTAYRVFVAPRVDAAGDKWTGRRERLIRHRENVDYYLAEMETAKRKALKATTRANVYASAAMDKAAECRAYIAAFKLPWNPRALSGMLFTDAEAAILKRRTDAAAERSAKAEERAAERERVALARAGEVLEAWRRHEPAPPETSFALLYRIPIALRLDLGMETGAREGVETSHGARVSLGVARRFWEALTAGRAVAGDPVGPFEVREVGAENVRIGCHVIPRAEMNIFAAAQGWTAPAAGDVPATA